MKNKDVITFPLFAVIFIITLLLLFFSLSQDKEFKNRGDKLKPVGFEGTYAYEDGVMHLYSENTDFDADGQAVFILKGHFTSPIPEGSQLLLRMHRIRLQIWKNGEEIYAYGQPGSIASYLKSQGSVWDYFYPRGISTEDDIEIRMERVYGKNRKDAYNLFLEELCIGDRADMLYIKCQEHMVMIFITVLIAFAGLVFLIASIILKLLKTPQSSGFLFCALFMIDCGIWQFINYDYITLLIPSYEFVNMLEYTTLILIGPLLARYISCMMVTKAKYILNITQCVGLIEAYAYFFVQGQGIYDGYELQGYFAMSAAVMLLVCFAAIVIEYILQKKRLFLEMMISSLMFGILILAEISNFIWGDIPGTPFFGIGFVMFSLFQSMIVIQNVRTKIMEAERIKAMEMEVLQGKMSLLFGQIQPHFLYNCLASIKRLCAVDPDKAVDAISQFSSFLRQNLDCITEQKWVSFLQEKKHVENYVQLEKMRFRDRIHMEFQLEYTDFLLPTLTLQPLVENSIRYGITKKEEGGTVTVRTREEKEFIVIEVMDDGIGLSREQLKIADTNMKDENYMDAIALLSKRNDDDQERSHIGLMNIRMRIELQCHGTMSIDSREGEGTIITLMLPQSVVKRKDTQT